MATLNAGTGNDGNATVATNTNLSTTSLVGRSYGDMVGYSCNAITSNSATVVETPNGIDVGDEVLLMNLRGPGYGTASSGTEGNYETFEVEEVNGNTITFTGTKSKYYGDGDTDTNIGNGNQNDNNVILMRVPNYENLTVNNGVSLTCNNFNIHYVVWRYGVTQATTPIGGVIFLRVSDTFTLNGTVSTAGLGPRGANVDSGGGYGAWPNQNGGIGHPPAAYGANPGAGGSYGTLGNSGNTTYGEQTLLTKMHMGSGGGCVRSGGTGPSAGGGIIAIFATQADIIGTLDAKSNDNTGGDWAGGAGSGGSILVQAATLAMTSPTMDATGGTNSSAYSTSTGGDGRIALYYNTLEGTITNVDPTPYTEDDLELPYYIQGTISHAGEIRVFNIDWTFVRAEDKPAGPYTLVNLPHSGPFIVLADAQEGEYNILGYKSVTSVYN